MLVPLGHTQWYALVELLLGEADRSSVHGANQLVIVALFLIQQRGWPAGVKPESLASGVLPVGEVIHRLGDIRKKDRESFGQRYVVVFVFFQRLPRLLHQF